MVDLAKEIVPVNIEDELKQSYLDYAMSVIVGRALPDVRDGLKPVHRRILYAMHELGNEWNKPYKKSARVVGDVIGKYHPHGDNAVYDALVRMAQPFSMRYMLVDGQGNFGSVDGDSAAAMRYTEVRMAKLSQHLLADLEKETVDFIPNYDESEFAPSVLPTKVPNLLVNGSSGIAVGMATNIPPHNLSEVISGCLALIDNPEMTIDDLMQHIPGPDFPTRGIIHGHAGIIRAYKTGRGRIYVRARTHVETDEKSGKESIIVTELPYQVNKAKLVEKIADLVKEKRLEGITALRDESDKDGMRMVIELRRGEITDVILNNLFMHTAMQSVFGINMVALVDQQPRLLNLQQVLNEFIRHRREVVTRRTIFELRKARQRAHLLEGLGIALVNIDEMIALIKASPTPKDAKEKLLARAWPAGMVAALTKDGMLSRPDDLPKHYGLNGEQYQLSEAQVQAILELRLHRLTGLEQDKIIGEYKELLVLIQKLLDILASPDRLMQVIREELTMVVEAFGDVRRTQIVQQEVNDLNMEDLITPEDVVVTLSHQGYVKYQPLDQYRAQRRGGKGKSATKIKDEDFIERIVVTNTHDTVLCFSTIGKVYWLKVFQLPQASRTSRGRPIVNVLPLAEDERITAMLPLQQFNQDHFVVMATANGLIKKTPLSAFSRPRTSGIIALDLVDDDRLVGVGLTDGEQDIMLFSNAGKVIRFNESLVRAMGRTARGVRGMKLNTNQKVIALIIANGEGAILTATAHGYGKRTDVSEFRITGRGGQGVIAIQISDRNGALVRAVQVSENDEVMLITNGGTLVRTRVSEISVIGRNTQGVRLINLGEDEQLVGMQRIEELADESSESSESGES